MGLRFPVFLDIEDKSILVVGAGYVAVRRIRTLLLFGADITVVAREVPEEQRQEMEEFLETGKSVWSENVLKRQISRKTTSLWSAPQRPGGGPHGLGEVPGAGHSGEYRFGPEDERLLFSGRGDRGGPCGGYRRGRDRPREDSQSSGSDRRCLARSEETKKDKGDRA